jgi:cytoskeletal protein CcmA (bactofilin family)
MRKWWLSLVLVGMLMVSGVPVVAAPASQGSGGVHFGPYTLESGNYLSEDLVVFGGPVVLKRDSELDGDLTVFGPFTMEEGANLDGQLVVTGAAEIAGRIDGDVFAAGAVNLRESAYVSGDVAAVGMVDRDPGAQVEGEFVPIEERDLDLPWNITLPGPVVPRIWGPYVRVDRSPRWLSMFWSFLRALIGVVLLGLLALVISSLWAGQVDRIGRVIEEAPLTAYGVGLLTLILSGLAALLLAITICLSLFAVLGMIIVGVGVLFGWVGLGLVLGRRVLSGIFNQGAPKPVTAAVVGTVLISLILAMARMFGVFHALLLFLLIPPAAGAVLLTRFGTVPYATRGGTSGSSPSGATRPPEAPAPRSEPLVNVVPEAEQPPTLSAESSEKSSEKSAEDATSSDPS